MKAKWLLPLMVATAAASGAALAGDTALAAEPGTTASYPGPRLSVFDRNPLQRGGTGSLSAHAVPAAKVVYPGPQRSIYNRGPLEGRGSADAAPRTATVARVEYPGPRRSLFNRNPNVPLERGEFAPFEKASRR